ncbi:hypothetical protein PISMIDRAFT_676229 [Pisolithus microcarpus 441]|uniref:Uncharacterized protein n=1 Tax=Pisolithus microcarpus 441 TaxID=765257 RepID=A0A0C9ZVZ7_9AGAM|nr:hypothetical protein PISMIDRAFT_676229 [Pisolithus microcarpus 441]
MFPELKCLLNMCVPHFGAATSTLLASFPDNELDEISNGNKITTTRRLCQKELGVVPGKSLVTLTLPFGKWMQYLLYTLSLRAEQETVSVHDRRC